MSTAWVTPIIQSPLQRLLQPAPEPTRFNPRPAGVIRPGSTADAVLQLMRSQPERLFWRHQLIHITGRTRKAVDWALIFLESTGHIEAVDNGRSPRAGSKQFRLPRPKPKQRGRPALPSGKRRVPVSMRIREELLDKLCVLGPEWLESAVERAAVPGWAG